MGIYSFHNIYDKKKMLYMKYGYYFVSYLFIRSKLEENPS